MVRMVVVVVVLLLLLLSGATRQRRESLRDGGEGWRGRSAERRHERHWGGNFGGFRRPSRCLDGAAAAAAVAAAATATTTTARMAATAAVAGRRVDCAQRGLDGEVGGSGVLVDGVMVREPAAERGWLGAGS